MRSPDLRVLFVAPAGPRRGFGHLVRCRSLARAMGVRPLVAIRGGRDAVEAALALGCDVLPNGTPRVIERLRPDVIVVDDPIARQGAAWMAAGRRAGALVVSIHDLGLGCLHADLVVDGSVVRRARGTRGRTIAGTRYAVLDPMLRRVPRNTGAGAPRVLVSLGGGPRARRAGAIARAIADAHPAARIRVVNGLVPARGVRRDERVEWIAAPHGLAGELARADVAVVGGGVSLYEACALGVPAVAVPVVPGQVPTVSAFHGRGAALGVATASATPAAVAAQALRLIGSPALRGRVARAARALVDGLGARRVAATILAVARQRLRAPRPEAGAGDQKAQMSLRVDPRAACAA